MKRYERPLSEILLLDTRMAVMQNNQGEPNGSLKVNGLGKDIPVVEIGGDDNANSLKATLWDDTE